MRAVDWSKVPADIAHGLAYQAVQGFCQSRPHLEAHSYSWYWADFTREAARIRLPSPVLKRKLDGASIWTRTVIIKPGWEMTGGAAERDRATIPLQMTARVGWDETHRIAVLFFALGGNLTLESESSWLMAKR